MQAVGMAGVAFLVRGPDPSLHFVSFRMTEGDCFRSGLLSKHNKRGNRHVVVYFIE
jgi:hypothetical protein